MEFFCKPVQIQGPQGLSGHFEMTNREKESSNTKKLKSFINQNLEFLPVQIFGCRDEENLEYFLFGID